MKAPAPVKRRKEVVKDIATGGGTGGLFILLINLWVDDAATKQTLTYFVPAAAVAVAVSWSFVQTWVGHEIELVVAQRNLAKAKAVLIEIEKDPQATAEHKKRAREQYEAAELRVQQMRLGPIVSEKD